MPVADKYRPRCLPACLPGNAVDQKLAMRPIFLVENSDCYVTHSGKRREEKRREIPLNGGVNERVTAPSEEEGE